MIWALGGGVAGLICLGGALLFWALRRALRRGAADTAARLAGIEAALQDIADRPAALAPDALADLSTGLKDDLAIMFTYAGRLAAISHEQSDRVIACINALHGIETPDAPDIAAPVAPKAEAVVEEDVPPDMADDLAPGLEALALDDLSAADDGEPAFDADNLDAPDRATEDTDAGDGAAEDTAAQDDDLADNAPIADAPEPDQAPGAEAPPAADMFGAAAAMLVAQQEAADRIEARLASVAAGIMALSASTETTERLDAIAAAGDTRLALLSTLSQDVGAGLAALDAGQTALRDAFAEMGAGSGDADVARISEALAGLQTRTESLSHAVDAVAGAVDEAAEAAATAVMAAAQDRAAEDEARLQALCDRIAGLAGGQDAPSGDALGTLSAQVDGLQTRVAEMAELAAIHRDALARVEEAVAPDRLRLALDGAAERSQADTVRRAASRIVDMPALDTPPRPPKTAARD